MKAISLSIPIICLLMNSCAFGQHRYGSRPVAERANIDAALFNFHDGQYESGDITEIDSVIGDANQYSIPVEDSYNTLTHCYVFTTKQKKENGLDATRNYIGIYKNGRIQWLSDEPIRGESGRITGILDLNNDGKTEIISEWNIGGDGPGYLWIFGWDGMKGWRINALVESGESVIEGDPNGFNIYDAEGDGILEISDLTIKDGSAAWSWNGAEYGKWPDTPHVPASAILPRNKFDVSIKCLVKPSDGALRYTYTVTSASTSKQKIDRIYVATYSLNCESSSPVGWEPTRHFAHNLRGWWVPVYQRFPLPIKPGSSVGGYEFISKGLPAITEFRCQGQNRIPDLNGMTAEQLRQYSAQDIETNSKMGITISPLDPPSPANVNVFLDTLVSFVVRSRDLGWITSQRAVGKYQLFLQLAEKGFQWNRTSIAKAALREVLRSADRDSGTILSSEAYALIRFNSEYLLQQLQAHYSEINTDLDSVRAVLRAEYDGQRLGDSNFYKELDRKLDNAAKHLAEKNVKGAISELQQFQGILQKGYEKKEKHANNRFITEEAYYLLDSVIGEIIDRLKI